MLSTSSATKIVTPDAQSRETFIGNVRKASGLGQTETHPRPTLSSSRNSRNPTTPNRSTTQATRTTSASGQKTPLSSGPSSHRLLYRGALALPDSHMLLDGLSFTTDVVNMTERGTGGVHSSPSTSLLENPLILALESMRGRNLYLLGTVDLKDIWIDSKTDINMYIHHYSVLSHIYFENALCLNPITSPEGRTDQGIRVSFTENHDEPNEDFIIYGQRCPPTSSSSPTKTLPSTSSSESQTIQFVAARILPNPPTPSPFRPPRPDDPTPRKPPAHFLNTSAAAAAKRKREVSQTSGAGGLLFESAKRVKKELGWSGSSGSLNASAKGKGKETQGFKVPGLPSRSYSQPSIAPSGDVDVFGSVSASSVGKSNGLDELEKANKTVIKQAVVACLAKHGIPKGHPDFNDLYQTTYRGSCFALAVAMRVVDRFVEAHAKMYVNGTGENHTCNNNDTSRKNAS